MATPCASVRTPMLRRKRVSAGAINTPVSPFCSASASAIGSSARPVVPAAPASLKTRASVTGNAEPASATMSALPSPLAMPIAGSRSAIGKALAGRNRIRERWIARRSRYGLRVKDDLAGDRAALCVVKLNGCFEVRTEAAGDGADDGEDARLRDRRDAHEHRDSVRGQRDGVAAGALIASPHAVVVAVRRGVRERGGGRRHVLGGGRAAKFASVDSSTA